MVPIPQISLFVADELAERAIVRAAVYRANDGVGGGIDNSDVVVHPIHRISKALGWIECHTFRVSAHCNVCLYLCGYGIDDRDAVALLVGDIGFGTVGRDRDAVWSAPCSHARSLAPLCRIGDIHDGDVVTLDIGDIETSTVRAQREAERMPADLDIAQRAQRYCVDDLDSIVIPLC